MHHQDQNYLEASNETLTAFNNVRYYLPPQEGGCLTSSCGEPCYSRLKKLYNSLAVCY
eukprot:SAG11_NODE_4152_length_2038_cov_1.602888_1_plen_57_part_01